MRKLRRAWARTKAIREKNHSKKSLPPIQMLMCKNEPCYNREAWKEEVYDFMTRKYFTAKETEVIQQARIRSYRDSFFLNLQPGKMPNFFFRIIFEGFVTIKRGDCSGGQRYDGKRSAKIDAHRGTHRGP